MDRKFTGSIKNSKVDITVDHPTADLPVATSLHTVQELLSELTKMSGDIDGYNAPMGPWTTYLYVDSLYKICVFVWEHCSIHTFWNVMSLYCFEYLAAGVD